MRAARNSISLIALPALSACVSPHAGPPTERMPRPNAVQRPTGEAPADLVDALRDLDPVWVSRVRLSGLGNTRPIVVRVRRNGGTGPATDETADFIPGMLGNRLGSTGPDADRDGIGFDPRDGDSHEPDADGDALPDFADPSDDTVYACVPGHGGAVAANTMTGPQNHGYE